MFKGLYNWYHHFVDGRSDPPRILVLGLDASGKTTFLYKHRSFGSATLFSRKPEVVTTIPTIGFNLEQVEHKSHNLTCWDVGGCDKIRPLWRHYMKDTAGVMFFIDSNDKDRVEDAKNELNTFFKEKELIGVPLLVVANKADLPNAWGIDRIIEEYHLNDIRDRRWNIITGRMTIGDGIPEILDWVEKVATGKERLAAENLSETSTGQDGSSAQGKTSKYGMFGNLINTKTASKEDSERVDKEISTSKMQMESQQRELVRTEWLAREDCPEEDFLRLLESYELDIWDHYTHVRIAWVLITRHGICEGFRRVEDAIKAYIQHSARTDGKSFHATMTRFFCHMIAYSIHALSWESLPLPPATAKEAEVGSGFKAFLRAVCSSEARGTDSAAQLWDKALFRTYYSNSVMFGGEARVCVQSPDLQALPDIVPVLNEALVGTTVMQTDVAYLEKKAYWHKQHTVDATAQLS